MIPPPPPTPAPHLTPTLCLQVRNYLGFWSGFKCFVLVSAVCLPDWGSHFRLPPAFVVWSSFLCHWHLWPVLSFFATGICVQSLSFTAFSAVYIRVRRFVFALLALVSGYQCISQFFGIMLCACCSSASSLEIRTLIFFKVGYPVDSPTNSALKQTPFGIPP